MSSVVRDPSSDPEIESHYQTHVFAENTNFPDDQRLPLPMIFIVFNVVRKILPNTASSSRSDSFIDHNAQHDFEHPLHRFSTPSESKSAISDMLSSIEIPFSWDTSLYWKSRRFSADPTPLIGVDDVVARVSDFAGVMIRSAAEKGLKKIHMLVTIEKRIVISLEDFTLISRSRRVDSDLNSCRNMLSRMLEDDRRMGASFSASMEEYRSELIRKIMELSLESSELAAERRAAFGSKPAAKSAVGALERLRYDGSSTDDGDRSKLTCIICMEEVEIGSHLIRMTCSHVFHDDCILKWLSKSHTCPVCRFTMSTDF